jgi:hypothetical protein
MSETYAWIWRRNHTIGVHTSYSERLSCAFAYQGCYDVIAFGYSYQFSVGSKLYAGLTSSIILPEKILLPIDLRVQYGRSFSESSNLLKISADYYLGSYENKIIGLNLNTCSTIGIFVEKNFKSNTPLNGYSFGIALNWSLWDLGYILYDDYYGKYFGKARKW